jgi:alpha-1,6-mannosyltransferase
MRAVQARPDAESRWRGWPESVLTAGSVGLLILIGAVIAAAHAGVSQNVTLPDWWGDWPHRQPGQLRGWVTIGIVLLGAQCALWVWLARRLLRPWTATAERTERAEPDGGPAERARRRPGVGALAGIAGLWTLPLLVTGPMGSLDVNSYAAIGRLATLGLDPYLATPGWLTDGFVAAVDPMWRWTPTPYGPVQVALLRGLVLVAGDHVGTAVLLIRLVAVLGAACAVVLAVRAASSADRVPVLLITGLNPVVLVHVVSGAHLDVLIGALAVLVVGLARSGRPVLAMSLAVVAMSIKLPGAVLVAFVLLDVVRAGPSVSRPGPVLRLMASGLGTLSLVVMLCPDPFGWTAALGVPGMSRNGAAPSTWISYLVAAVTGRASGNGLTFAFTTGRAMTALVGAAAVCVLLWKATSGSRDAAFRGVGWALVACAVTAPALYPWYLVWGLFAAAIGSGVRGRAVLMALSCLLCLASAAGEGTGVLVTWAVVLLAVFGWTVWVGRDLLAGRPGDSVGRRAVPSAETRARYGMRAS